MKQLLLCALLLMITVSGCETPQDAPQPGTKPTAFDSTASIEFAKLNDTTYSFMMHKADARLRTEWTIEGMTHVGDIHTHTFATRGVQLIQARLMDSTNAVIRTLDTMLFVDTIAIDPRGVVDPSIFRDCLITFEFNGKLLETEYTPIDQRREYTLEQKRLELIKPTFNVQATDTSFAADTLDDHTHDIPEALYAHSLAWELSGSFDSLRTFSFYLDDHFFSAVHERYDHSYLTSVELKGARLERATANEVVYVIDGPTVKDRSSLNYHRASDKTSLRLESIDWSVPSSARLNFSRK